MESMEAFVAYNDCALVKANKCDILKSVHTSQVEEYPYIAINQRNFSIIHIDVDEVELPNGSIIEPAFDPQTFLKAKVPLPNCTVISSDHRYHAFWFLERSLPLHPSYKSINFYNDVRRKLVIMMKADPNCNVCGAVRSPYYKNGLVKFFTDKRMDLYSLNINIRLPRRLSMNYSQDYGMGSRNCTTFKAALQYHKSTNCTYEQLVAWIQSFQQGFPQVTPLPMPEQQSIAASIIRNGLCYRGRAVRNYGKMGLPMVDYSQMYREERLVMIRERQSLGADFTNQIRRNNTIQKIMTAREEILKQGLAPTQKRVSEKTGLALSTIGIYWKQCLEKSL